MDLITLIKTHLLTTSKSGKVKFESQRLKYRWFELRGLEHLYDRHKNILTAPEQLSKSLNGLISGVDAYNYIGECSVCSKSTKFVSIGKGFKDCCSSECVILKKENNSLYKHGVKHQMHRKDVKDKVKRTNIERYGGNAPMCSENVKNKLKSTNLERYGVENTFQVPEFKDKSKETRLQKYGGEYTLCSPELLARVIQKMHTEDENGLNGYDRIVNNRKNDIDENGLNGYDRIVMRIKNDIDENGLNGYDRIVNNRKNDIDENGLNGYDRIVMRIKNDIDENGLNGYDRIVNNRKNDIDENGLNGYDRAYLTALLNAENGRNSWIPNSQLLDKQLYYKSVWKFTNKNDLSVLKNIEYRGYNHDNPHSLDHKYSISQGFINRVPPYLIGSIFNLEMLPHSDNIRKGIKCSITLDCLAQDYS